jgi:YVTN family beta-propeller protein
VDHSPVDIAITPDGALAYVTHSPFSNIVSVIETASNSVLELIDVGGVPWVVAVTPDGRFVYVTRDPHNVSVIETVTNTVVATIDVGLHPLGIAITPQDFITVAIDIRPGSNPNSINLGSKGNVPVAILSTADFDATTVNPATVTLADAQVTVKGNGTLLASLEDVNADGLTDLVVHVTTAGMSISDGDVEAVLTGETFDGQTIRGSDSVRVVP